MIRLPHLYALAAAALFGITTPFAKILLDRADPWMLASLFYLGSGIGLAVLRAARQTRGDAKEAQLKRADAPWLAAAIFFGGVVGPILLMVGLANSEAATASLLLTLEGAATALLAWFVFRENFDRRIALGMALLLAGSIVLTWRGGFDLGNLLGPLAVIGACIAWGIDNNLTRKVSLADPTQIAMLKGLIAGAVNLALALCRGAALPDVFTIGYAAIIGFLGYGLSLMLFVTALRHLGSARTSAYFSIGPFIGAALAIPLIGEPVTINLLIAGALMAGGIYLHLTERHKHAHEHQPMSHAHRHVHDEHHRHRHNPEDPPGEPHSHQHVHVRLRHEHAHTPDAHHRHRH